MLKETLFVRSWSFAKVKMLWLTSPSVIELNDERTVVRIPLNWRTKNHLGSMYFGVLCIGADCAGGLIAMKEIQKSGKKISLIFADFKAEFHKRPEGDVHFTCEDGAAIRALVQRTIASGERESIPVTVIATVPKISNEPVASFVLTLSLKARA
jgi:acyl-coenzyme A thioesterase PaaI-like protein